MDIINWQEIAVRLLFAFILGSATAISKQWYRTQKFIQSNTQMALGAAIFAMLANFTSENTFSSQLILGISIICVGVSLQKKSYFKNASPSALLNLWCAGALGSMAGSGFFVPAYIGIVMIIVTNLLFHVSENSFIPEIKKELNSESKLEVSLNQQSNSEMPLENCFHCQVNCLPANEAEVLALLVQLGKEKKLTPTRVDIKNLVDDHDFSQVAIQVEFISNDHNSLLQIQQILTSLKSKMNVISASFVHKSPKLISKNNESIYLSNPVSPET